MCVYDYDFQSASITFAVDDTDLVLYVAENLASFYTNKCVEY